jgi:DNA-binding transcriptional LysR family regulator
LIRAAEDGAGILLFPDWQLGDALRAGKLITLMNDIEVNTGETDQSIYLLYPVSKFSSLNTRTVIDYFVEKFGSPPYWQYISSSE